MLDEVTSLPLESQPTLLRVLETGEVTPFGDDKAVEVDLRVVAAAQPSIRQMLSSGMARLDLFERLAVATVVLPPLRARPADIRLLAEAFAKQQGVRLHPGLGVQLQGHAWPGNVRELKSVIARAAAHAMGMSIGSEELAKAMQPDLLTPTNLEEEAHRVQQRERLRDLCVEAAGDWRRLVELTCLSRASLYRHLGKHGLHLRHFRHS